LLGAFAAHGLKGQLSERMLAAFKTGVEYQFLHSLGLMLLTVCAMQLSDAKVLKRLTWARSVMVAGVALFSGSLYVLSLAGLKFVAFVTPIGGVLLVFAWLMSAAAFAAFNIHKA